MRRAVAAALAGAACLAATTPGAARADAGYRMSHVSFDVVVGPQDDTHCDIVADLYEPNGADAAHPVPAVMTTNGFGGSKDDQRDLSAALARHGYVVLDYSGLGFGGSGCKIELDDPQYDGKAGSQLISFLAGTKAATDGTRLSDVQLDAPGDPRVGMVGASYAGQVQFAIASIDHRLDALVPLVTWNDLAYSLTPNDTDLTTGVSSSTPGVDKYEWASLFAADGIGEGVAHNDQDPSRNQGRCPNFDPKICPALLDAQTTGAPDPDDTALLRAHSVASYAARVDAPTLLLQGEDDTLFNLDESQATYDALKGRVPVKLVWQSWGHSHYQPAPGELGAGRGGISPTDGSGLTYEGRTIEDWLDFYLGRSRAAPSLDFTYFRPWVSYTGDATPAYGRAPAPGAGETPQTSDLSGTEALVPDGTPVASGAAAFATPPAGAPASQTEVSGSSQDVPLSDTGGTYAAYTGPALTQDTDVVGSPRAILRVRLPAHSYDPGQAASLPALFVKLEDVAPDGSVTLPNRLIAPIRPGHPDAPVTVTLPAIVHRFAAGHRLRLVVAGSDSAYRGSAAPASVAIVTDPAQPSTLTLPVMPAAAQGAVVPASVPAAAAKACASHRQVTVHVRRTFARGLRSAVVYVGSHRVARLRRGRLSARVRLGGGRGTTATVRIVMRISGRAAAVTDVRRYRLCRHT